MREIFLLNFCRQMRVVCRNFSILFINNIHFPLWFLGWQPNFQICVFQQQFDDLRKSPKHSKLAVSSWNCLQLELSSSKFSVTNLFGWQIFDFLDANPKNLDVLILSIPRQSERSLSQEKMKENVNFVSNFSVSNTHSIWKIIPDGCSTIKVIICRIFQTWLCFVRQHFWTLHAQSISLSKICKM